jgi:hypothetical protein
MAFPEDKSRVEVDASSLTYPEWFFLWAAFGQKPDANLKDANEWHKRSLGMSQKEKLVMFREGLEGLMSRGVIAQAKNKDGSPAFDAVTNQAIYVGVGRIVSRVTGFGPAPKIIA